MLVFPEGVKLATSTDIPFDPDLPELLARVNSAKIEPGYIVHHVNDRLFQYYVEVNVNAPQLWSLFRSLCNVLLPEEVQPVVGDLNEEITRGKYTSTVELLELFEEFQFYLAHDCYLQFGLGKSSSVETCEIFVTATKHFQIWTNSIDDLEDIMSNYGLCRVDNLQFIDEFPRITLPLKYDRDLLGYQDILDRLIKAVS
jgi:hypothetical protein